MAETRLSDAWPHVDEEDLPASIRDAYRELQHAYPLANLRALKAGDFIRFTLDVDVNLPSRGSRYGIQRSEPITLTFVPTRYPFQPPMVQSDRSDFPKTLPHLNPVQQGQGAWLCLHRGNFNDWFAEHTIVNLVERARGWLADAAAGLLVRKDDLFEGTLVPENHAYAIYDAVAIDADVRRRGTRLGHLVTTFRWLTGEPDDPRFEKGKPALQHGSTVDVSSAKAQIEKERARGELSVGGLLAWPDLARPVDTYFGSLPGTLGELVQWSKELGIDMRSALDAHAAAGIPREVGIPLTLAIPRGRKVIGTDLTNEYITFLLFAYGDDAPPEGAWKDDARVVRMSHRRPVTTSIARELSSLPRDAPAPKTLLLGAGALGSKISLHLGRRGQVDQTIVDHDSLEPHNFVRHGLLADALAHGKAEALARAVSALVPGADPTARHVNENVIEYLRQTPRAELAKHEIVLDLTASSTVFEALLEPNFGLVPVVHCEISDGGRLGILLKEGRSRVPRIDDLQAVLHDLAVDDDDLSTWLQREHQATATPRREQIHLGMSCSSDTLRLADDVVSHHAAAMSGFLRSTRASDARATIQLSWIDPTGEVPEATKTRRLDVGNTMVRTAANLPTWKVRFVNGTAEKLLRALQEHKPREIGGSIVGFAHFKRWTTYVTRVLDAPTDSHGSTAKFVRGVAGLPEEAKRVERRTAGLVGYIGEWHTHPRGGARPSATDIETTAKLTRERQLGHAPTMLVVVTPGKVTPYVYE